MEKKRQMILGMVALLSNVVWMTGTVEASSVRALVIGSYQESNAQSSQGGRPIQLFDESISEWIQFSDYFEISTGDDIEYTPFRSVYVIDKILEAALFLDSQGNADGLNLYNMLVNSSKDTGLSIAGGGVDDQADSVSIPASIVLLGVGILGLVGFRRQSLKGRLGTK